MLADPVAHSPSVAPSPSVSPRPSRGLRATLLLLFVALVCLRMPAILGQGRLWAEEGIFYQNAWSLQPWRAALLDYGGYLNLVANTAALLARYTVPLEAAPWIMTGVGMLFQLCPAVLIVTSPVAWLRTPLAIAACLFALAAAPIAEETWLQTLHSQYHLTLCVALILAFDDCPSPAIVWFRRVLLLLAPLCGVLAALLAPLLILRALFDRSRERTVQCGLLLLGAALQLGLFYSSAGGAALGRSTVFWPGIILDAIVVRHIIIPIFGLDIGARAGANIRAALAAHATPVWPALAFALSLGALAFICLRRWRTSAPWLLTSALGLAAVSYYAAIDGGPNFLDVNLAQRYSFVPQVILVWTLVCVAATPPFGWIAKAAAAATLWLLLVAAVLLPRSASTQFANGPAWREEIRLWQQDPSHHIRLWPKDWGMSLNPDHTPAPVAGRLRD